MAREEYTQHEILQMLNERLPKELMPDSGIISQQAFSKRKQKGRVPYKNINGTDKYDWVSVAKSYGMKFDIDKPLDVLETIDDEQYADLSLKLTEMLEEAQTPKTKVDTIKVFWEGERSKLKFLEESGELISVNRVMDIVGMVVPNLKESIYKIPSDLKAANPILDDDIITDLGAMIDMAFQELQGLKDKF